MMEKRSRKENLKSILSIVKEIYGLVPILFSDGEYIEEIREEEEDLIVNTEYVNPLDIRSAVTGFDKDTSEKSGDKSGRNSDMADDRARICGQLWNAYEAVRGEAYVVIDDLNKDEQSAVLESAVHQENDQDVIFFYVKNAESRDETERKGYELFFEAVTKNVPKYDREMDIINLLGIIPGDDPHFRGNLDGIEEILRAAGYQVNRFFGTLTGTWEIENISRAALNLSFSGQGEAAAKLLQDAYNTPYLSYQGIPVGPAQVRQMLGDMEQQMGLTSGKLTSSVIRMEEYFQYYLKGICQSFYQRNYTKWIGMIGRESDVLSIGNFLKSYLGAGIRFAVITDGGRDLKRSAKMYDFTRKLYFSLSKEEIKMIVEENDIEILIGSSEQRDVAKRKGISLIEYSAPLKNRAVLSKSYAGIRGAVSLMEDYVTAIEMGAW